ncbi:MAG: hypothetical protein ACLQRH_22650 [Acidimicrobiales bacterium]
MVAGRKEDMSDWLAASGERSAVVKLEVVVVPVWGCRIGADSPARATFYAADVSSGVFDRFRQWGYLGGVEVSEVFHDAGGAFHQPALRDGLLARLRTKPHPGPAASRRPEPVQGYACACATGASGEH